MVARAVLIAAAASGQGKTTVTAALARKLVRAGRRVRVFKCGPDFIDPMVLARACGAPVESLDLWMVGPERCRALLAEAAAQADAILVEGVMGLYDGTPSAADLSREFGLPVLAVIDAGAMAQTAGALVHGLRAYGPVEMAGVVANRIASANHAAMVAASLRDIPLLGTLPKQAASLPERHLGLVLPDEVAGLDELLDTLAEQLSFDLAAWDALPAVQIAAPAAVAAPAGAPPLSGARIAVARDAAFMFLYPSNLSTLQALGARLEYFSPLADEPLPRDATAVYLPGGYPELHCSALAQGQRWQASLRAAHADGLPIVAECGGMMALAETLQDKEGKEWPMAGLLPGKVLMQARLAGLGAQAMPTALGPLRGHTFHYSRLETAQPAAATTQKNPSGAAGEAVYRIGSLQASYFHGYFPSNPAAVAAMFFAERGMTRTLVFGGARSGKSAYAERLAANSGKEVVYIATAAAGDAEMTARIAQHQAQRPAHWRTIEQPLALAAALAEWRAPQRLVLVDCLTLWLSNLMFSDGTQYPDVGTIELPARFHQERAALLAELAIRGGDVVLVSNEVGMGIVPWGAVSRSYADEAGRLNQAVAAACDRVAFVAAGLPLMLKDA